MSKEFNLSEKAQNLQKCASTFPIDIWFEEDIKKFIKILILTCPKNHSGITAHRCRYCRRFNKLAGPKLTK